MTVQTENNASRRRSRYPRCPHAALTHIGHWLTCAEYDDLLAIAQGRCMICMGSDAPLCVDHDHKLGRWAVRGLVCRSCNCRLRRIDSGEKVATCAIARYLANAWHVRQPGSAIKQGRTRPRAECAGCGTDVAVRPDGRPWHHWLTGPHGRRGPACPSQAVVTPRALVMDAARPAEVMQAKRRQVMGHQEITKDGATWFWYCEQVTGKPGLWRPVLQCDGWVMCDAGLAFLSAEQCQEWIDEAVKASSAPVAAGDEQPQTTTRKTAKPEGGKP